MEGGRWWPFDWKTPLGYFLAWFVQSAGLVMSILLLNKLPNKFFGPCWLSIVMADDNTKDLAAFNKDVEANANRLAWMKRFREIIQLYSEGKE